MDSMQSEQIMRKAESWWEYIGDIKLKQFLFLALIIYMLPSIIRTIFDILVTTLRSMVRMVIFAAVVGIGINLYFGNSADLTNALGHVGKFFRKMMKPVFGQLDFD